MQDVVIIPTYDRPEMLWLCLEHIAASPDAHTVHVKVYVDAHVGQAPPPRADIDAVVKKFPQLLMQVMVRQAHGFHGNSYNVLMAYKQAYESASVDHVFMIEDDILIQPEFFAWHRAQHQKRIACSIGMAKEKQHGPYASMGVCFKREMLRWVMPHIRTEYFQNLRGYCKKFFPPVPWDCEQDGLFCRVLPQTGYPIVWPTTSVSQHVGWYGYHRKRSTRPTGDLDQRYQQVKLVLGNARLLQSWSKDFGDVRPVVSL